MWDHPFVQCVLPFYRTLCYLFYFLDIIVGHITVQQTLKSLLLILEFLCEAVWWSVDPFNRAYADGFPDGTPMIGFQVGKYGMTFLYTNRLFEALLDVARPVVK